MFLLFEKDTNRANGLRVIENQPDRLDAWFTGPPAALRISQ